MYFFPFHAFGAKKMYNLRYRFAQATHFKTRNVVYIVERGDSIPRFSRVLLMM